MKNYPTPLELIQHKAIEKALAIKHRINGCPDKTCHVCMENAETIKALEECAEAYDYEYMPQFKHDSTCCVFLGRYIHGVTNFDLYYYCAQQGMPTVLARYGDMGHEYSSGFTLGNDGPRAEAMRRARQRGLLP